MRMRSLQNNSLNIWPGFVDALSALVLVMLFTFMMFIITQFHLSETLNTRDKSLSDLNQMIASLQKTLSMTRTQKDRLVQEREVLEKEKAHLVVNVQEQEELLRQTSLSQEVQASEVNTLKEELEKLNAQLQALSEVLGVSEKKLFEKDQEVVSLSFKLDQALKERVKELADYRSEFFGNLKKILGEREDIRVVGDRFIFQSEVLFDVGSDKIGEAGQQRLHDLAGALKEIAHKIPVSTPWILRVDGHTDVLPIKSASFPSNWELSMARAISVVKFLIDAGIAPQHLVAAGFGEFHPLDSGNTPESLARNRRIEFKLDQR